MAICPLCNIRELDRRRKRCNSCNTKIRRIRNKRAAVHLLGGKCNRCGWTGNYAAFEFHHKDPTKKEFTIGMCANKSWESIKEEVLKCELVCSNCHRIEHSDREDERYIAEALIYKGKNAEIAQLVVALV